FPFFGELPDKLIEQITCSASVDSGDRIEFIKTQRIKFNCIKRSFVIVRLIGHQQHRFILLAQQLGDGVVKAGDTAFGIHHKKNDVRFFNGNMDLFTNAGDHHIGFVAQVSPRIDEIETAPVPGRFSIVTITGDTVLVVHNSLSAADKTVKDGGLADVAPSYN